MVGLQTKTDALKKAMDLFTTDEALRRRVANMETDVAVMKTSVSDMKVTVEELQTTDVDIDNELAAANQDITTLNQDVAGLNASIDKLKNISSTNIVTHRDYLHQLLTLDRNVDLSGPSGKDARSANLYLPINSYEESEPVFQEIGRFRGWEGRNTLLMLFHLVSVPRLFALQSLNVEDFLNVSFTVSEVEQSTGRQLRQHAICDVLLNDYVNSESLTFIPMHFVLRNNVDLVLLFRLRTPVKVPFPPEGALKISKERTAILHYVPLFAYLGGKAILKPFPSVADLRTAPPFEDFANLSVRMMHHTRPVPPFYVHHRVFVKDIRISLREMHRGPGVGISNNVAGGITYFNSGRNTHMAEVGTSTTTKETIWNLGTVGTVGNTLLGSRYHIHGVVMPEYIYFGVQGYPLWLEINGFNMRPGVAPMCVQVIGFASKTFGTISDLQPTIVSIEAKPPDNTHRETTAPDAFPQLIFRDHTGTEIDTVLMSWFTVNFPSVHDSDHFSGGGPLVTPEGVVNWETICRQFPASPRYNMGIASINPQNKYNAVGIFFCPKEYSGSPYNYVMSDSVIYGLGNDGTEGIMGEGVFRSAIRPNGYPPLNKNVWFPTS